MASVDWKKKILYPPLEEIAINNSKFFHLILYDFLPIAFCLWTVPTATTVPAKIDIKQIRLDVALI